MHSLTFVKDKEMKIEHPDILKTKDDTGAALMGIYIKNNVYTKNNLLTESMKKEKLSDILKRLRESSKLSDQNAGIYIIHNGKPIRINLDQCNEQNTNIECFSSLKLDKFKLKLLTHQIETNLEKNESEIESIDLSHPCEATIDDELKEEPTYLNLILNTERQLLINELINNRLSIETIETIPSDQYQNEIWSESTIKQSVPILKHAQINEKSINIRNSSFENQSIELDKVIEPTQEAKPTVNDELVKQSTELTLDKIKTKFGFPISRKNSLIQ